MGGVAPSAALRQLAKGLFAPLVDIVGQVLNVDTTCALLASLGSHEREGDPTVVALGEKFLECEMGEDIAADLVSRDDCPTAVLAHQEEQSASEFAWLYHATTSTSDGRPRRKE
jgi:hypothetical protein